MMRSQAKSWSAKVLVLESPNEFTPNYLNPAVHDFIASSFSTPPIHQSHPAPHRPKVEFDLPYDGNVLSSHEELQREYLVNKKLDFWGWFSKIFYNSGCSHCPQLSTDQL